MRTANSCRKHLKPALFVILCLIVFRAAGQNTPLPNAFAHNDYWHKRPLYDAIDNGYTNVEADIYLRRNKLIVAHVLPCFKTRTLEQLYLDPLLGWFNGTNKSITGTPYPITLMVDIKSDADKTYDELCRVLVKYKQILSTYDNGQINKRQVTVVLTGHKPKGLINQNTRLAFIDEDLIHLQQDTLSSTVYQTASCRYSRLLNWVGKGFIPPHEKENLCTLVKLAHLHGKKVRLWGAPENETVWKELLNCGVDLINTDKLVTLRQFLLREKASYAKVN